MQTTASMRKIIVWEERGSIQWQFLWNKYKKKPDNEHDKYLEEVKNLYSNVKISLVDESIAQAGIENIRNYAWDLIYVHAERIV